MSNTSYIAIKSSDRSSGSSHSFTYRLPTNIRNVKRISLLNAEIPLTHYTVRSGVNNTFQFIRSAVTYTATVTPAVYTATTLMTALATAMNSADGGTTFSFTTSSTTLKATLTATNSITVVDTNLSKLLGFTAGQAGTTIEATNTYVVGDQFLFIRINNLPTNMISSVPAHYRIQVTADTGYVQFVDGGSNPQQIDLDGQSSINHLDISIVDSYGSLLPLNGSEFSMLLKADYDEETYVTFPAVY